jgi:hypothetical protein
VLLCGRFILHGLGMFTSTVTSSVTDVWTFRESAHIHQISFCDGSQHTRALAKPPITFGLFVNAKWAGRLSEKHCHTKMLQFNHEQFMSCCHSPEWAAQMVCLTWNSLDDLITSARRVWWQQVTSTLHPTVVNCDVIQIRLLQPDTLLQAIMHNRRECACAHRISDWGGLHLVCHQWRSTC